MAIVLSPLLYQSAAAAMTEPITATYNYTVRGDNSDDKPNDARGSNDQTVLRPKMEQGKKTFKLDASANGKTVVLPVGTLVFLYFPEGTIDTVVGPVNGILQTPTERYNLPNGVAGLLKVTGQGIATLKVSHKKNQLKGGMYASAASSQTWSGYARTGSNGSFTDISSNWKVPQVTCNPTTTSASSAWIGIDGATNMELIQTGTASWCDNGTPTYQMWWEILPAAMTPICTVSPGDSMYARIQQVASTSFRITINDLSNPGGCGSFTDVRIYTGPLNSAEWIVERPLMANGGQFDLASYDTVSFENNTVNGASAAHNYATESMNLTSNGTQSGTILSTPSFSNSTYNGFSTTYCDAAAGCRPINVSPSNTAYNEVHAIAAKDTSIWAAGWEYLSSRVPITYKYNGSSWTKFSPPPASSGHHYLYGIAAGNSGNVWTVGSYTLTRPLTLAYRWDGSSWTQVNSDNPSGISGANVSNELYAVAVDGSGTPWTVGQYWKTTSPSGPSPIIQKWDGTKFAQQTFALPTGYSGSLKAINFNSSTNGWAVGSNIFYRYDGSTWTPTVPSGSYLDLTGVASISDAEAWAVGNKQAGFDWPPVIMRYNGTSWSEDTHPVILPADTVLTGINAASSSDIWVIGYYTNSTTGKSNPIMLHFDGFNWTRFDMYSVGSTTTRLFGVANKSGTVWAGGLTYPGSNPNQSRPYVVMH